MNVFNPLNQVSAKTLQDTLTCNISSQLQICLSMYALFVYGRHQRVKINKDTKTVLNDVVLVSFSGFERFQFHHSMFVKGLLCWSLELRTLMLLNQVLNYYVIQLMLSTVSNLLRHTTHVVDCEQNLQIVLDSLESFLFARIGLFAKKLHHRCLTGL